jgi:DNA-binding transcriptional MerR regulator
MAGRDRTYSPADVEQLLGIPKTTLFRWEDKGLIVVADKDEMGRRHYSRDRLDSILLYLEERVLEDAAPDAKDARSLLKYQEAKLREYQQVISVRKILEGDPTTGFAELIQQVKAAPLVDRLVGLLLREALEYEPADWRFGAIIDLVHQSVVRTKAEE